MCSRASSAKRSSPSRKAIHCPELCITPVLRARSNPLFSWWMTLNRTSCAAHWSHMALLASVEPSSTTINSTSVLFCLWRLERHSSRYAATLYTATITDSLYVYLSSLCMGILGIEVSSLFLILHTKRFHILRQQLLRRPDTMYASVLHPNQPVTVFHGA